MKQPKIYTRAILAELLPRYCRGATVDVGAGNAKYRDLIKKYSATYTSVDDMSSDVQYGSREYTPDVVSSVFHMPFQDGQFDTVICTQVFEHVDDPFALMKEIARILKSGGHAIIASPWVAPYHPEPKDFWRFSVDGYEALCNRSGLEMVTVEKQGGFFSVLLYFFHRTIELNMPRMKKLKRSLGFFTMLAEKNAAWMDRFVKTQDAIGYTIVARKK